MSKKSRSINQLVGNRGSERRLSRADAFTAYVMDRLLFRLGRSKHAKELFLKGGLLVDSPHRFTRDIDLLRRHGRPSPDDLREMFREIVSISSEDGIEFKPDDVRAIAADHDEDGYDSVKVFVRAKVARREVEIRIDIGFGDAVVPPASRVVLTPFLDGDEPARVFAYDARPVIAEKIETLLSKFPVVLHRLKDILDVVTLANAHDFTGAELVDSLRATLERRETVADIRVLDDMRDVLGDRKWQTAWASMRREKAVADSIDLATAIGQFDTFVRPILLSVTGEQSPPTRWEPVGPWHYDTDEPR